MELINQPLELSNDIFEGPVIKPESYLLKAWGEVFHRTGWCHMCIKTDVFEKTHGEKAKAHSDGLTLKRDILKFFHQNFEIVLSDNWDHISYQLWVNNKHKLAFMLEDHCGVEDFCVSIACAFHTCGFFYENELMDKFLEEANKHLIFPEENPQIYLIQRAQKGYETQPFSFDQAEVDLDLNYGENFRGQVHDKLVEFLKDPKPKHGSLVMFHGEPGTGKTYYIRKIISEVANSVKFIYIPAYMVDSIADPHFIDFLRQETHSVLVIEDAESVICTEGTTDRSVGISNLLQVTDGILKDCLKLKVILTFNTNEENIDKALKRDGRLFLIHYFGPLKAEDAKKKAESLGLDTSLIQDEMTLAEVYNLNHKKSGKRKKENKIGF